MTSNWNMNTIHLTLKLNDRKYCMLLVLSDFFVFYSFFFQNQCFQKKIQEYHQSVKQSGYRLELVSFKLFATAISG